MPHLHREWQVSAASVSAGLHRAHCKYADEVSGGAYPISLQLASFLMLTCRLVKPTTVLDLGSGFSSYVFRLYQLEVGHGVDVISVDDDPTWLERTREFLAAHNLSTSHMVTWDSFRAHQSNVFDLTLYDSFKMGMRAREFSRVLRWVRPGTGILVLDDFQQIKYRARVHWLLHGIPHTGLSLHAYTHDPIGRFSYLLTGLPMMPVGAPVEQRRVPAGAR